MLMRGESFINSEEFNNWKMFPAGSCNKASQKIQLSDEAKSCEMKAAIKNLKI
jgi:hypothetical protein